MTNTTKTKPKTSHVTFFTNAAATKLSTSCLALPALRDLILCTSATKKAKLPWLKLARFGDKRTPERCLRHNENVVAIDGVEADYDGERISFDAAAKVLTKATVQALIYTSPSHSSAAPRWRILAPTSKSLPPDRRAKLVAQLDGLFGGVFARESYTLSTAYYFGRVGTNPAHRAKIIAGNYIDRCHDLVAFERPPPAAMGGHEWVPSNAPIDPDLLVAALEVISADEYWSWLYVGAALYHELGDDGFEPFQSWSATSHKYDPTAVGGNGASATSSHNTPARRFCSTPTKHRPAGGKSMRTHNGKASPKRSCKTG